MHHNRVWLLQNRGSQTTRATNQVSWLWCKVAADSQVNLEVLHLLYQMILMRMLTFSRNQQLEAGKLEKQEWPLKMTLEEMVSLLMELNNKL